MKLTVFLLAITALFLPGLNSAQQAEHRLAIAEKKPTLLVVYADWCPMCQKLKPLLSAIADKYRGRVQFVRYDITSNNTEAESKAQAKKLGFQKFFAENRGATSLVVILDPAGHEQMRVHSDYVPEHYEMVLDRLLQTGR
jgi:thiol-disulfide isomerase/thioredoxin